MTLRQQAIENIFVGLDILEQLGLDSRIGPKGPVLPRPFQQIWGAESKRAKQALQTMAQSTAHLSFEEAVEGLTNAERQLYLAVSNLTRPLPWGGLENWRRYRNEPSGP
ncbi:MAG: hypothetical protein Q7R39_19750, partial [Dehalococcoidia bacterium]|nr:hypothetical protein [Dehalococcoidia bacterium]